MPDGEDFLRKIKDSLQTLNKDQVDILAKQLSAAFLLGWHKSGTGTKISELQRNAINQLSTTNFGYLQEYNQALGKQLETHLQEVIRVGGGYEDVKRNMKPYIEEVFGPDGAVTIDRTGQTKEIIKVLSDGSLQRAEKTISQPYSASLETYSDMLSRTSVHAAYSRGRAEGYKSQGLGKWRYISVQDERVRPSHLALHGSVFEYGTAESDMAEEVLQEVNCRCRQIPFFDDPRLDAPQAQYDKMKDDAGLYFDGVADTWAVKE